MLNCHLVPKMGRQQTEQLGRQTDFRHHQKSTFAFFQAFVNQFQIDGGLSRTGHAVQQGHAGFFLMHLAIQVIKNLLLFRAEHQRAIQNRRTNFLAAQDLSFRQHQITQFHQSIDGGRCRAGVVAQFLDRDTAQAAHQLQYAALHCRRFRTMGSKFHCFFRRSCQGGNLLRFVLGLAQKACLAGDPLFLQQILQNAAKFLIFRNDAAQSRFLCFTAHIFQTSQHFQGEFPTGGLFFPAYILRQAIGILLLEPQARREHNPNRLIESTEIPLSQKGRQPQHIGRQQGFLIQHLLHGF